MKKILLLSLCIAVFLCGCTNNEIFEKTEKSEKTDKISVIATIFPQYDFLRQIAGDCADITLLIPPGGETHSYEPNPSDIVKISSSQLFVHAGGSSDAWVQSLLKGTDLNKTKVVALTDIVPLIKEGHSGHNDEHKSFDEHVWTSPVNAIKICNALTEELCAIDEKNADVYKKNSNNYIEKLKELDKEIRSIISEGKRNTIIFADRFPIKYFTTEYNLDYICAFPGCAQETEPAPRVLTEIIEKVESEKIPIVFYREFSDKKVAELVTENTDAKALLFHSCHNVSKTEFEIGETYLSLMKKNADNLKEALN